MKPTNKLLANVARIAKKRGLKGLTFTLGDLGDLYHVYGVNVTASHLVDILERRKKKV